MRGSGYNPGRRPGRGTILSDLLMIGLALIIVVLAILVFILRGSYDRLIPVIFILGTVMNGVHALHCFGRDGNRKRNIPGTVCSILFCIGLAVMAVLSGVTIWGA